MDIFLARTQGYCSGVHFAVSIVKEALKKYKPPIYVLHEIVHNTYVVNNFKKHGVVFVEDISLVPENSLLIFSAHGVPPSVSVQAKQRNLNIIDATCPLVRKVHNEAINFSDNGYEIILIGHKGHQEIIGTSGYVNKNQLHIIQNKDDVDNLSIAIDKEIAYITQTTLSVDETKDIVAKLHERFKNIKGPKNSDLCYATQNRQNAVKELAKMCDIIIICGSPTSSNSNRLRETGEKNGTESHIIDSAKELDMKILENKNKIGISSGASVPKIIVEELVSLIKKHYPNLKVHSLDNPEKQIKFKLPEI